jgi:hypothetical protein
MLMLSYRLVSSSLRLLCMLSSVECASFLPCAVQDFWTDLTNSVDVFSMGEVLHGNTM